MCCWFNYHYGSLVSLTSSWWGIFAHLFPSNLHVSIGFQGVHLFHLPCVRTLHAPSLACRASHTLATNKEILLAFVCNRGQGDTVWPIARTPTPNGLRSSWDFLPRRSLDILAGPVPSTFLALERGPDDKLCPYISGLIFAYLSWILLDSSLRNVSLMPRILTSRGSFLISCLNSHIMVKVKWPGSSTYKISMHLLIM